MMVSDSHMTLATIGLGTEEISAFLEADARGDSNAIEAMLRQQLSKVQDEIFKLQRIEALLKQSEPEELMRMALIDPSIIAAVSERTI